MSERRVERDGLADELGLEPAPQNEVAVAVDDAVAGWLGRQLT